MNNTSEIKIIKDNSVPANTIVIRGEEQESADLNSGNTSVSLAEQIAKSKKPKFEERHSKSNFWVENELLDILNSVTAESKPGLKTFIINEALRSYFKDNGVLK